MEYPPPPSGGGPEVNLHDDRGIHALKFSGLWTMYNVNVFLVVFITIIHSLAIILTILRLTRRIRIKLVSWDDWWVGLAAVMLAVYLGVLWQWKWISGKMPKIHDLPVYRDAEPFPVI